MSNTASLVILLPWFGPWPFWMPAFLASCRCNTRVRWELFGDHPLRGVRPANVSLNEIAFPDYCKLVSDRLGIRFKPANAYKLCDLKPALGAVHQELLGDCRFWAFSDLDLVYGDLLDYFAPALEHWDIISTHQTRVSGHLTLIRNTGSAIHAFRQATDWQAQLEAPDHTCFDESGFSRRLLPHKQWPRLLRNLVYARDPLVRRTRFREEYTSPKQGARHPWVFGDEPLPQRWEWRAGKVTADLTGSREFPYFHFIGWKSRWAGKPREAVWQLDEQALADGWCVTPEGFFPLKDKVPA